MTYGYNTSLKAPKASNMRIVDHRRDLIQKIVNARSSPQVCMANLSQSVFLMRCLSTRAVLSLSLTVEQPETGHYATHELYHD